MQTMTEYETTMVLKPELGGDQIEAVLDRVREVLRGQQGKLLAINHWGKKKLAYEIAKQGRGTYVHAHYLGRGPLVGELERNLRINDGVLRFMTVRMASDVAADSREEVAYTRPEYDALEPSADDAAQDGDADGGPGERSSSRRRSDEEPPSAAARDEAGGGERPALDGRQ